MRDREIEENRLVNYLIHEIPNYRTVSELKGLKNGLEHREDLSDRNKKTLYSIIDGMMWNCNNYGR